MEHDQILSSQTFNTVDLMIKSSANWGYNSIYKLLPQAFEGENHMISLPTLQLSYARRSGGALYENLSPKGMISVGIVHEAKGKFCFSNIKLQSGDILFFDDTVPHTLITSDAIFTSVISIPKATYRRLSKTLKTYRGKIIRDTGNALAKMMEDTLAQVQSDKQFAGNTERQRALETELLNHLDVLLETQTPYFPKLTKGEKIALAIFDRIYHQVNDKVTINALAKEFGVSEQTLQNAFKSFFGFTPNRFIRHLKLNHVRKALIEADPKQDTIVSIANRWGFTHMGHFSRYYTQLFEENPSVTLQRQASQQPA